MPSRCRENDFVRLLLGALAVFCGIYLVAFFPFAYFRHDDWLILGNAVRRVPGNWRFLFEPTLYYVESMEPWFFRPLFKLFAYVFHLAFGYRYWLWLTAMLACTVLALALSYAALRRWTGEKAVAVAFVAFFVASLHVHLGSQVWLGEGLMNCPQLLGLASATYAYVRASEGGPRQREWTAASVLALVIALGFKESSIFHAGFLAAAPWVEPSRGASLEERARRSAPYVALAAVYLPVRLWGMPMNPYYFQKVAVAPVLKGLLLLGGSLVLPFGAVGWLAHRSATGAKGLVRAMGRDWLYWAIFLVSLLPYLGHVFFSAGWLLVPAYHGLFLLALAMHRSGVRAEPARQAVVAAAVLGLSLVPVGLRLAQLRWWSWHQGQRDMASLVDAADPRKVSELVVLDCAEKSGTPHLGVDRVVGFEASLYEMWALRHGSTIPVRILPCGARVPASRKRAWVVRWEFPRVSEVTRPAGESR